MLATTPNTHQAPQGLPKVGLPFHKLTLLAACSLLASCAGFEHGFQQGLAGSGGGITPRHVPVPEGRQGDDYYYRAPDPQPQLIPQGGGNSAWGRVSRAAQLPPAQLSWDASQNFYGATQLSYAEQQYRQAEHQGRMQPLQNARQQLWETQNTIEQFRQFGQYLKGFNR